MKERLSPAAQLLLWAYERGSLPYDLLCLFLAAVLFMTSAAFWHDPLVDGPVGPSAGSPAVPGTR
jgi:hypothetical protein